MNPLQVFGALFLWTLFNYIRADIHRGSCPTREVSCADRSKCLPILYLCDGKKNCKDGSDEIGCDPCAYEQFRCSDTENCVDSSLVCNGEKDCPDGSDEEKCDTAASDQLQPSIPASEDLTAGIEVLNVAGIASARAKLISWFRQMRKSGSTVDKWGSQLPRVAVALHLANESFFSPENTTGQEMSYELTIQLLHHLSRDKNMSSQELALYIHAMLAACIDPRDFYGLNLVQELRKRTEANANYTNPFQILVLCNAGDKMTTRDVEEVIAAYDSQHRPFWTDTQALASLALACLSTKSNIMTDEKILKDMLQELKKHQFTNGTVDNLKTTALVLQALLIHDSFDKDFDVKSALQSILQSVSGNVTLLNAYYALPVLTGNSLLNVGSSHCTATPETEAEALEKALNVNGETISVQLCVWFGEKIELARTWRLKMHPNNSIYDVIETVAKIDNRQKVEYNVVEGKPFVTSLGGIEDDPEKGTFWFVHLRNLNSDNEPELIEQSPVDLKLKPNQEIIMWYKPAPWSSHFRGPISTKSN
ncbi:gastric intrinsic factor [Trichonephila inaurata madagascariensis]|uniref:Gastric intrinsic factor n=1 Tax=Trichonephila inaurata madagascariensis TaxID=2747483 RepID=A0A8X6XE49_9ARAC|nr:gastric intrinsic factor [Trichonephila inaurata madagascariensis]